jgi:hypothetical protein
MNRARRLHPWGATPAGGRPFASGLKLQLPLLKAVEVRGAALFAVCSKGASLLFLGSLLAIFASIRSLRFSIGCTGVLLAVLIETVAAPRQQELVARPHLVEDLQQHVALTRRAKQGTPTITTTRDEVQMALPVTAFETVLQGKLNPMRTLCKRRKECGTPNYKFKCKGQSKSLRG